MQTKQQVSECIYRVLAERMSHPSASAFHSDAHLRDDLGLDSSSVLQLLVHLELDHGLALPEEAVMNQDLDTVRQLLEVLHAAQPRPDTGKILEYEEDIKLHCFVSCLSEAIKRRAGLEHRVLYFGVWDSEIVVDERLTLSYHSPTIKHDFFVEWYARLYGVTIEPWYDPRLDKDANAARLVSLVERREPDQHILVMLDMYQLPERVNEFNKDPFPHYLMLGPTARPEAWMVYDPDYRWEGVLQRDRILHAMQQPSVAGGYVFSTRGARSPSREQIGAYLEACLVLDDNPMTTATRRSVTAHLAGRDDAGRSLPLSHLPEALDELPILAIRKYAYEHGLAFFWRELNLREDEFEGWCDEIARLVKTYKLVQFQAIKLAATGDRRVADGLFELLDEQDARETRIKRRLHEVYGRWLDAIAPATPVARTSRASL